MTIQELRKQDEKLQKEYLKEISKLYAQKYKTKHEELRNKINEMQRRKYEKK